MTGLGTPVAPMSDQQQQNSLSGTPSSKSFSGFGAFSASSNPGTSSIANPSTSTPKPLFGAGGFGIGQTQNQPQGQHPASGGFSGWLPPNPLNSATTGQTPGASNVPPSSQGAGAIGDPSKPTTNPLSSSQTPSDFSGFPKPPGSAFFTT
ncbi:MAG TPA: hypothetical protein VGO47_10455, partial [Chlamydiales bacterium]|nr:hypothetical protein [Chlamydiales bacterium]